MSGGWGRRGMIWLLVGLIGYGAVVAAVYAFQRNLQYFPSRFPQDAEQLTGGLMRTVTYRTADGLELSAWYRAPVDGQPVLVRFHGNGGQHGDRARSMLPYMQRGYGVLLASYRGYGENPGSPTEEGLYADARAALDWLALQGIGPDAVVLYGESLGSAVAVQMAAERPVAALVLEAPFTSAVDVGQAVYRWLPVGLLMKDRFDSLSKIDEVSAPLLLLHGEVDPVIAPRFGRRLFEAANEPKTARFVPGGGHSDLDRFGIGETVLEFLATLPGVSAGSG